MDGARLFSPALERRIDLGYDGVVPDDSRLRVHGHAVLLGELVRNLVDNAVNYSPDHSTIDLRAVRHGEHVEMSVSDSGPGIPPAERELVFQPFYRALGTNVDGSGLGLPIVREIAQRHGASIGIDATQPGQALPVLRIVDSMGTEELTTIRDMAS